MTRDEAKEILAGRYIVNIDGEDEYCNKVNEAIDMAIEALEREEKWLNDFENNVPSDLISRADAIDALYRSSVYSWSVEQDQSAHTWALNIIAKLPSADIPTIVPCKDCERRYVKGNTTNYYWCRENDCPVDDNDFCSWAKMKGGGE